MATSPVIQRVLSPQEVAVFKAFQTNADARLASSQKVVTASENFELNGKFFEANSDKIKKLVADMSATNAVVQKLVAASGDAGTCKVTRKEKGFFGMKKVTKEESIASVTAEIQGNLNNEVVVASLRALGILPTPKAPFFSAPSAPSSKAVKTAAGVVVAGSAAGATYYFRNEIETGIKAAYGASPEFVKTAYRFARDNAQAGFDWVKGKMPAMPSAPAVPSFDDVKQFFNRQWENVKSGASTAYDFSVNQHPYATAGVGAALTILAGVAVYKAVQNKNKQAEEAAAAAQTPVAS